MPGLAVERALSLGEWAASDDVEVVLSCLGLGSCVAVIAHDAVAHVGGMAHVVLPDSTLGQYGRRAEAKFADLAVPLIVREMVRLGAVPQRLRVALVGGARMLVGGPPSEEAQIGERNVVAVRAALQTLGLRVRLEDTGGTQGRTVHLAVRTGEVMVSTLRAFGAAA